MYQMRDMHSTRSLKLWPALFLTQCTVASNCWVIMFLGLVQACNRKYFLANISVFPKTLVQKAALTYNHHQLDSSTNSSCFLDKVFAIAPLFNQFYLSFHLSFFQVLSKVSCRGAGPRNEDTCVPHTIPFLKPWQQKREEGEHGSFFPSQGGIGLIECYVLSCPPCSSCNRTTGIRHAQTVPTAEPRKHMTFCCCFRAIWGCFLHRVPDPSQPGDRVSEAT